MKRMRALLIVGVIMLPFMGMSQFHYLGGSLGFCPGVQGLNNSRMKGRSPASFYMPVAATYHYQIAQWLGLGA